MSTSIKTKDLVVVWRGLFKYPMVNSRWECSFPSEVYVKGVSMPLIDSSAYVGFCTSNPQQVIIFNFRLEIKLCGEGVSLNIPWKILDVKVLDHLGFMS
jgi:hypothetical protein